MTTTTIKKIGGALDRRALLSRALVGAAIGATAAMPVAAATVSAVDDPVPGLLARRRAVQRHLNDNTVIVSDDSPLWGELNVLEKSIETAVPTTREGVVAQLEYLIDMTGDGWDFDDRLQDMVRNTVAGLNSLAGGAA